MHQPSKTLAAKSSTPTRGPSGAAGSASGNQQVTAGDCKGRQVDSSHISPAAAAADWWLEQHRRRAPAMFPRAAADLNLLCFLSFHHHFLLFDFYLLIYFCLNAFVALADVFFAKNLCNTIKGIILQRVFFFSFLPPAR